MSATKEIHRDDQASKFGMWLFLFTEMLLFGGLFIVYSVHRYRNAEAFHLAAQELSVLIGTVNTIILLVSSATIAMSITAVRKQDKKLALLLLGITVLLGIAFLVNKYFKWGEHITEHIYPGSSLLARRGQGDVLFYGLYFFMTGLHALHIIIGLIFIGFVTVAVIRGRINSGDYVLHENCGLYWHLVDMIWIFLSIVLSYYLMSMERTENKDHIVPYRTFLYVLALLIGLTLVSVALTQIYLGSLTVALALIIAGIKSSFILRIFMHLKFESRTIAILVSFVILLIVAVIVITLLDYLFR